MTGGEELDFARAGIMPLSWAAVAALPADVLVPAAGRATRKEKWSTLEPGAPEAAPAAVEASVAVTVTRSPGANARAGANWVPAPAGCALSAPG